MIRWRFVLTRIIVIIAILALLRWGLGPVANYATIRGVESLTGARVEIGESHVGLFPPRVQHIDVHIADPRDGKEMRDAIVADGIDLVIDGEALLHRRWVAKNGRINGLQIGTERTSSGQLLEKDESPVEEGPSMLSKLLSGAGERVSDQADAVVDDLETVRRSKAIRQEWEAEYDELAVRARNLEKRIREIRDRAQGIDNPLRDWAEFDRTLAEANEARAELVRVHQTLNGLPERLRADLAKMDEAKQIDLAKVDKYVPGDMSNAKGFGVDMMASVVKEQIAKVRSYLDGGRALANYTVVAPESSRVRGFSYDFNRVHRPQMMIRRCEVSGLMRANKNVYAMTGVVENMTPSPELLAEPTRTRLRLEGPETLRVEYVRDRRAGASIDLFTVHWPEVDAAPMRIGDKDDAAITIAGGKRELWVQVRSEGDEIEGRLVSKQSGVSMDVAVDRRYANSAAAVALQRSLGSVDRIEIDASFAGTWNNMRLDLDTNLGHILSRAGRDAIDSQLRQTREQVATKIEKAHREQVAKLREWLVSQQSEALSLLANADTTIEEMRSRVFDEVGLSEEKIGNRLQGALRGVLR